MPYFVVVQYQAWPGQVEALLTVIRHDFEVSAARYPGRRFARVFRHDLQPERLLAMEEWQQQADFEQHAGLPEYADALARYGPSPRPGTLARLQHYRHMSHVPAALACAIVSAPADRAQEVESFICDEQRREALVAEGLVLRAVYRIVDAPGTLLVLHGWRTADDLDAYFATGEHDLAATLQRSGADVEQFTGQIAAQFSWLEA
jgi:quinol monooxygenase YgiN